MITRILRKLQRVAERQWIRAVHKREIRQFSQTLLADSRSFTHVVVMDSMPWDHPMQQRPQHMARNLANLGVAIVYIDRGRRLPKKVGERIYVVNEHSYLGPLADAASGQKYFWLFSTVPLTNKLLHQFVGQGFGLIYDYMDDFHEQISGDVSEQRRNFADLKILEPKLLLASARHLEDQLRVALPDGPRPLLSPNAVDMGQFDLAAKVPIPEDLFPITALGRPIIGYYGAVAPWLDYSLLNQLTRQFPSYEFVFIGEDYKNGLSGLEIRENVHYLGLKQYRDLPSYSAHFDCAIIPFQRGEIAKSTSPVKLFEYMAMGLPTICTADLRECNGFDHVFVSADEEEFAKNIDKAIQLRKDPAVVSRLVEQARENTWQARAQAIYDELVRIESESD